MKYTTVRSRKDTVPPSSFIIIAITDKTPSLYLTFPFSPGKLRKEELSSSLGPGLCQLSRGFFHRKAVLFCLPDTLTSEIHARTARNLLLPRKLQRRTGMQYNDCVLLCLRYGTDREFWFSGILMCLGHSPPLRRIQGFRQNDSSITEPLL